METFKNTHYIAPIVGLNYYFVLNGFRLTRLRNKILGDLLLWITPLLAIAALFVSLHGTIKRESAARWQDRRAQLLKQLRQQDGKHLVIVSYGNGHSYHDEWVYNDADIDRAKVIFARAINDTQDCQLIDYFKSRRTWSLEVDWAQSIPTLKPYPLSLCK
jgi:hypothetical protein